MSNDYSELYGSAEVAGMTALVIAGALSLSAIVPVLAVMRWWGPKLGNTRIMPFFVSLMVCNVLQAVGTLINSRWVMEQAVVAGNLCTVQGSIKQAGNIGMALWSLVLSLHVFMLLFVRHLTLSALHCWVLLVAGWFLIAFTVAIGPAAIQTPARGPYFGPTGFWCWITQEYPKEQFYLEYFFEFLSVGLSFILYTAILLRVRGNLIFASGKWHLRFVSHGDRWRLAVQRDFVDNCMMHVAARVVWYPVAYAVLLLPITTARFIEFGGHTVPFRVMIFVDFIANLQGLVTVALLLMTRRFVPDTETLPMFEARKHVSMSSPEAHGITPFVLSLHDSADSEKGNTSAAAESKEVQEPNLSRANSTSSTFILHIR